jgi:hypothetical protein
MPCVQLIRLGVCGCFDGGSAGTADAGPPKDAGLNDGAIHSPPAGSFVVIPFAAIYVATLCVEISLAWGARAGLSCCLMTQDEAQHH